MQALQQRPKIVVVGGGFGGLEAVRQLADKNVDVVLIDRRHYHLFQPLLYQVATAALAPADIASSTRSLLRKQENLEFRMAEVAGVDFAQKTVQTSSGEVTYDYLIVAVGGETNFFGMEDVQAHAFGLKDIDEAIAIRNHILLKFEEAQQEEQVQRRKALLTFAVSGGGATGVECAGALTELIERTLLPDYPALLREEIKVVLVEAGERLLPMVPEALSEAARQALSRKGVEVRLQTAVAGYDGACLTFRDGSAMAAHTMIWASGVKASSLVEQLQVERGRQNRVLITPTLQVPGAEGVFCIGDAAGLQQEGVLLPMVAPVAVQQANLAVENIMRLLRGEPLQTFSYQDKGAMATVGRNFAVAKIGPLQSKGFLTWVFWLLVHLLRLEGNRNRLAVFFNWGLDYWFATRLVRLIRPRAGTTTRRTAESGSSV